MSNPFISNSRNDVTEKWIELRKDIASEINADRWIEGEYPTVAPFNSDEMSALMKCWSGPIMIVGSGTDYPDDFKPQQDCLVILTTRMSNKYELNAVDQVLVVDAGYSVTEVNSRLADQGCVIPALSRFNQGTIGGRLATVSSRQIIGNREGWVQSLLSLTMVLPDGEKLTLGGRCIKDVAGYDLRHIFTGSRGLLGVITAAGFRCLPNESYQSIETFLQPTQTYLDSTWRRMFDPDERMRSGV